MRAQLKLHRFAGDRSSGTVEVLWRRGHRALVEAVAGLPDGNLLATGQPPWLVDVDELIIEDVLPDPYPRTTLFTDDELRRRYTALDAIMKAAAARLHVEGDPWDTHSLEFMAEREAIAYRIPDVPVPDDYIVHVTASEWGTLQGIRDAVTYALTQEGDSVCWLDLYTRLAELTRTCLDPQLLPPGRMLANCQAFVTSLHAGHPYVPDAEAVQAYRAVASRSFDDPDEEAATLRAFVRAHVPRLLGLEPTP